MMDFSQISLILVAVALFGIFAERLKQPILIGYLLAGLILASSGIIKDYSVFKNLGDIGVTLLLFLVGLEMNIRDFASIGKVAAFTGIGQIILTFVIAFIAGILIGFDAVVSGYIAFSISISSTIIAMKILSDKNALNGLYGKISVGILLIQNFVAIFLLIIMTSMSKKGFLGIEYLLVIVKALLLVGAIWLLSKKVLPRLFEKYIASSPELLFISSIAWALGLASLVAGPLGFSFEMGGLLAGIALSNLPEHLEIGSRTRPLKDFFLTMFFLSLGASLITGDISKILVPALIFSVLVIFIKPLVVMLIMGRLNLRKRTCFMTSVTISQVSEFSLKIAAVGVVLGHLRHEHLALTVVVAVATMTISAYFSNYADRTYIKIKKFLTLFEKKNPRDFVFINEEDLNGHVVLVGCLRTGARLISYFKKMNMQFVIVDFDPDIYRKLNADGYNIIFGDITDPDILDAAQINKAKMIISTIDNLSDNLIILEKLRHIKNRPLSIFTSVTRINALRMYEKGADYVIVPEIVAGDHIRNLLKMYGVKSKRLRKMGQNHFKRLIFS